MPCPLCGYMMSAFDKECPRCLRMGKPINVQPSNAPPVAQEPVAQERHSVSQIDASIKSDSQKTSEQKSNSPTLVIALLAIGLVFILLFAFQNSGHVATGNSSPNEIKPIPTSSLDDAYDLQDHISATDMDIRQGAPTEENVDGTIIPAGDRTWYVYLTLNNNSDVILGKGTIVAFLDFDDYTEAQLQPDDGKGNHHAMLKPNGSAPAIAPGQTGRWKLLGQDTMANPTKKPTKLKIEGEFGEVIFPIHPN